MEDHFLAGHAKIGHGVNTLLACLIGGAAGWYQAKPPDSEELPNKTC